MKWYVYMVRNGQDDLRVGVYESFEVAYRNKAMIEGVNPGRVFYVANT